MFPQFNQNMLAPNNSLVAYDTAILVSTTKDSRGKGKRADDKTNLTPTEDILNSILPPREYTDQGQLWVQYVSSNPATRQDVITLQEHLDQKLQQKQARETGICPIREELYAQCFDELIRQVTINCVERGVLLLRVRDEIRVTIACYQTLYESSIAFGMRTSLQAEQKKVESNLKISMLENEQKALEKQVMETKNKILEKKQRSEDERAQRAKEHKAKVDEMRKKNAGLKAELETLLWIPKEDDE